MCVSFAHGLITCWTRDFNVLFLCVNGIEKEIKETDREKDRKTKTQRERIIEKYKENERIKETQTHIQKQGNNTNYHTLLISEKDRKKHHHVFLLRPPPPPPESTRGRRQETIKTSRSSPLRIAPSKSVSHPIPLKVAFWSRE